MCGKDSDAFGDHAISACGHYSDRSSRHDDLRDAIFAAEQAGSLAPTKEERNLLDDASHPGDITIRNWHRSQGRHTAFDVTVTSPLQQNCIERTVTESKFALEQAANNKFRKCRAACEAKQLAFVPLPVTTLGAWHPMAAEHLRDFARLQASRSGRDKGLTIKHFFERLSILLQRGNANMLFSRSQGSNLQSNLDGIR
jgi:hypothetical protein